MHNTLTHIISEHSRRPDSRYGSLVNDYVSLPWDENWVDECCFSDYLHYNTQGIEYILSKLQPIAAEALEE